MVSVHPTPPLQDKLAATARRQFTLSAMLWLVTGCCVLFAGSAAWWRYDLPALMYASAVLFGCFSGRLAGGSGIFCGAIGGTLSGALIAVRWALTDDYSPDFFTIVFAGGLTGALTGMNLLALEAITRGFYRAMRSRG